MVAYFLSADWGKRPDKRSVFVADVASRQIRACERPHGGWNLNTLLEKARRLAWGGRVLVGVDVVFGVPRGYWKRARWLGGRAPATFVNWLGELDPTGDFYGTAASPEEWRFGCPWFRVRKGPGGLDAFKRNVDGGMLRAVERATGGKPVFAVSGIPGTIGSGTREFWRELGPRLSRERDFEIWPFEGDPALSVPTKRFTLCEAYPRLAYAAALAENLPTATLAWPKSRPAWRGIAYDCLGRTEWMNRDEVALDDLGRARENEDDFDALFTAAAVLRCVLENRPLCCAERVDPVAEGAMILAGVVEPDPA